MESFFWIENHFILDLTLDSHFSYRESNHHRTFNTICFGSAKLKLQAPKNKIDKEAAKSYESNSRLVVR